MNYEEALEYIHAIPKFRRPLGNAKLQELLARLGNPQDRLRAIHIAGTNGKGSTAAMTAEILKEQGGKIGLFTSPYIEIFNERIRVNGALIPDAELCAYTERVKAAMESGGCYVSEFAFITALAFLYFYEKRCDWAVIETGMGGRLDATNVIRRPALCVLTSIGLDHMQYLGDTVEEIAREKCGIIKRGCPVVSYPNDAARDIITDAAGRSGAELAFAEAAERVNGGFIYKGRKYPLGLSGAYQTQNAAVVIECVDMLRKHGVQITDEAVERGLANVKWGARYEFLSDNLVIDGGHNIDGIRALKESLQADGREIILVTAMMRDKSFEECIREIAPCAKRLFACELDMPRCAKAEEIAAAADGKAVICENPADALNRAMAEAKGTALVCVCGSLYLAGEVKRML